MRRPSSVGQKWGSYRAAGAIGLGVWGHDQPGRAVPGAGWGQIITPTIDIYTSEREQRFDDYGRALNSSEYRTSSGLTSGRVDVGEIMRLAGERGRTMLDQLTQQGVPLRKRACRPSELRMRSSVRKQTSGFPSEDFGERWSWPYGLRVRQ